MICLADGSFPRNKFASHLITTPIFFSLFFPLVIAVLFRFPTPSCLIRCSKALSFPFFPFQMNVLKLPFARAKSFYKRNYYIFLSVLFLLSSVISFQIISTILFFVSPLRVPALLQRSSHLAQLPQGKFFYSLLMTHRNLAICNDEKDFICLDIFNYIASGAFFLLFLFYLSVRN